MFDRRRSALLKEADAGLVPNRPSGATRLMLPVKNAGYATLGIPIIAAPLRRVEYYFGEKAVSFFEADRAERLAETIENLYVSCERGSATQVVQAMNWHKQRERYFDAIDSSIRPNEILSVDPKTVHSTDRPQHDIADDVSRTPRMATANRCAVKVRARRVHF